MNPVAMAKIISQSGNREGIFGGREKDTRADSAVLGEVTVPSTRWRDAWGPWGYWSVTGQYRFS